MQLVKKALAIFSVFFIFATLVFSVYMRTGALFTSDDPYYHAYRASALWSSDVPNLPLYSAFQSRPANFYIGYYWSMAPFTSGFKGDNFDAIVLGSKVYHTLLIGCLYSLFFFIALKLLKTYRYAFLATAALFALSRIFSFRSFLPRPHILSIIVVLFAFYFCICNSKKSLFVLNIISPFTYSTSFFSIVPGIVYAVVIRKWWPALLSLGGLALGLLIRPDSFNYFYDAYLLHLLSVLKSTVLGQPGPSELASGGVELLQEPWIFVYMLVLGYAVICYMAYRSNGKKRSEVWPAWSIEMKYTVALSFLFYIPFMFVVRTIEYTLPFSILAIGIVFKEHLINLGQRYSIATLEKAPNKIYEICIIWPQTLVREIYANKKVVVVFFLTILIVLTASRILFLQGISDEQTYPQEYAEVAKYLEDYSNPGDIVAYQDFAVYNRLVFFRPNNRFPTGIDPVFTQDYDPKIYWTWLHMVLNEPTCAAQKCDADNTMSLYEAIHDVLHARYFILGDPSDRLDQFEKTAPTRKMISEDTRFVLVHGQLGVGKMAMYEVK